MFLISPVLIITSSDLLTAPIKRKSKSEKMRIWFCVYQLLLCYGRSWTRLNECKERKNIYIGRCTISRHLLGGVLCPVIRISWNLFKHMIPNSEPKPIKLCVTKNLMQNIPFHFNPKYISIHMYIQ